jgi:LL-diaminopimelate aminotransferase
MSYLSKRIQALSPNYFAALEEKIKAIQAAGGEVIRLDIGSPDLPPADHILEALKRSASAPDHHGYQPHRGPAPLRPAWTGMYARQFGVELDPESEVVPLLGSKEGIFHLTMAFVNPGEIVLVPDPGYITYTQAARFAEGRPYPLALSAERDYLPDLAAIPPYITAQAKLLWLNYPNNPTAATATVDFFAEAVEFARENHLLLCHDAAYIRVAFDGYRPPSLLEVSGAKEVAIEFNTLSKAYNMAGWRVGAALGNARALRALFKLKSQVDSSHFLPVLEAAVAALDGDQSWLEPRNETYRERRDLLLASLRKIGLKPATPRASLYIWCPVPDGWSDTDFAMRVLEVAHISLTPGSIFGRGGEGHIRISLTRPTEKVAEAASRLERLSFQGPGDPVQIQPDVERG